jgi:circadian clock protein KaiC
MTKNGRQRPARKKNRRVPSRVGRRSIPKAPTGIAGLDEITRGGLPRRRATLVCGGPGSGKTLLATQFLAHGATGLGEPGVFVSFEEPPDELIENSRSLGIDLRDLIARGKVFIDYVRVERSEIVESGGYDLDGLFIRLGHAIDSIKAKRVVLDTIEMLFSGFTDAFALRAELHRLFQWLKTKGVTTIVTGERGAEGLTRHGLEEYLTDCVIVLDQRVTSQEATRRVRILKYRGSAHSNNEFPFLIDDNGLSVLPITSLGLHYDAPSGRVSTGVPQLDELFANGGYYRGSSVLISGQAGTGKSSLAALFARAAVQRGERCLYFGFEESPDQIVRNMRSIGIDLAAGVRKGLLQIQAQRPTHFGLEAHLVAIHRLISEWRPEIVIMDPISNLTSIGTPLEVKSMLSRLQDFVKGLGITTLSTFLIAEGNTSYQTDVGVSSLMDVWMLLQNVESNGERNRALQIVKARGSAHSNQIREFVLTDTGLKLIDVHRRVDGRVLVGSSRQTDQGADAERAAIAGSGGRP